METGPLRVMYTEDEEYPGEFDLWNANCRRSLQGRNGQKALRALKDALLSMPVKELQMDLLVEPSGQTCAIGARMIQKKVDRGMSREKAIRECAAEDASEVQEIGIKLGMPPLVAWSVAVENDYSRKQSPKERYRHMLDWVKKGLNEKRRRRANATR